MSGFPVFFAGMARSYKRRARETALRHVPMSTVGAGHAREIPSSIRQQEPGVPLAPTKSSI
ncbi:hypothetical protein D3C81_1582220 [compost metagenome]